MNSWLKGILIFSAVACVLSFGTLGWLAVQTTEPAGQKTGQSPAPWKQILPHQTDANVNDMLLARARAAAMRTVDELAARLRKLNESPGIEPNELLLTFKSPEALEAFRARAARQGLQILHDDPRLLTSRVRYSDAEAMARELKEHSEDLDKIGLNYLAWVPGLPDTSKVDPSNAGGTVPYGNSGLEAIGAQGDRTEWGRGVKVAVLDTGVTDHQVFKATQVTHYDLVNDGQTPNGHGTAMASLIAGQDAYDGGVAPASQLLDIRVADVNGESNTALVAEGIMKAVDEGAQVINISLGTTGDATMLKNAIDYALDRGVVVVAAAGNEQQTTLAYPAGYEGVISVGAVDANDQQAYFSNSGENLSISAPGVGIVSAYSDNRMVVSNGTSQATAITTGTVSMMLGWGYASQNIAEIISQNARSTGAPKNQVGAGVVQVPKR